MDFLRNIIPRVKADDDEELVDPQQVLRVRIEHNLEINNRNRICPGSNKMTSENSLVCKKKKSDFHRRLLLDL